MDHKATFSKIESYEEHSIAKAYFKDVSNIPLLTAKQERRYARLAQKGSRRTKNKMIRSNLRLVITIALRYLNRGLHLLDLVSEGNFGLIRAIEKYDPDKGFRFSTYATWWIRQSMERAIGNQARLIRIPGHILHQLSKLRRIERNFEKNRQRHARIPELANILDLSDKEVELRKVLTYPLESIHHLSVGANSTIEDHLIANKRYDPEYQSDQSSKKAYMLGLLKHLNSSQQEVICMRFGLLGYKSSTLEFIANHIGKTRERVRQIQIEAIKVLSNIIKNNQNRADLAS